MSRTSSEHRYLDGSYLARNPGWHQSDSPWKADLIAKILNDSGICPRSICDVGCGAGQVLAALKRVFPASSFVGYDISADAAQVWQAHDRQGIKFVHGDFHRLDNHQYDCILLIDVIEHLENPFRFLAQIRGKARFFVFHFPLDLSVSSILRETRLLQLRERVGHIHYFTKGLVFALLLESGFELVKWRYTNAFANAPGRSPLTRLASVPRRLAYLINKDIGVRLLGGETLLVLAKPKQPRSVRPE